MSKTAFIFPGQGSQYPGMGKDLADTFPAARRVFEEADDALGLKLSAICFSGNEAELKLTANTQPAILTASIAVLRVVEQETGLKADYLAGHSLAHGNALPLHLWSVADLKPHTQFASAVVEQQNGEDAVRDHDPHQLRRAAQQGFQVQRGVQRVGKLHQVGHIGRFHANICRVQIGPRACRISRAVVALKLGFVTRRWGSKSHGC